MKREGMFFRAGFVNSQDIKTKPWYGFSQLPPHLNCVGLDKKIYFVYNTK